MGGLTVESSSGVATHTEGNHVQNDFNSSRKKKRRFRGKRSKKNTHSPGGFVNMTVAVVKHDIPCAGNVADVKLYTWALLKKEKILCFEARVLGLGPRFMSLYIPQLAIERHIYYDEVEGLTTEWLENTSTLLLSQSMHESPKRKNSSVKLRSLNETAMIVSPTHDSRLNLTYTSCGHDDGGYNIEPMFFPLTLHRSSTIPVALHAIGGGGGPLDIVARLYVSSYFH